MSTLEVITGPMFSGKSKILKTRLEVIEIAERRILVVKPKRDDRTPKEIGVRTKKSGQPVKMVPAFPANLVETPHELMNLCQTVKPEVLAMDEAQFFGDWIVDSVAALLNENKKVGFLILVAGLDMDYRRQPFGPMPQLMALADNVTKLKALCDKCKTLPENAIFTQKLSGSFDVQIEVGDRGLYEARCRICHTIPE